MVHTCTSPPLRRAAATSRRSTTVSAPCRTGTCASGGRPGERPHGSAGSRPDAQNPTSARIPIDVSTAAPPMRRTRANLASENDATHTRPSAPALAQPQFAAALAFLGTGWFIDKVGLRRGFAIGVGVWSLAGMAHAFASTVAGFVTSRAVLGAAESIGTPAAVKTAATYFNAKERSFVLGLGGIAPNVGAILTPLLIPLMAMMWGWQATFLIAGGLGLVWVVVWLMVRIPEQPNAARDAAAPKIAWRALGTPYS